jgi:RHS repeat-associated protein
VGNILTWRQQADTTAVVWEYGYDLADQLTAAVKTSTDPTPAVLARYAYAYDSAGNRTVEQIDGAVMGASYNEVNELVSQQPAGAIWLAGTVSEPATVTVAGKPVVVTPGNGFSGTTPIVSGTNTVAITATDPSGNSATATYEIPNAGATKTFTYDANGNMTSDGTRTFEWDARNQLVGIGLASQHVTFAYDGLQRRVSAITEHTGVVVSNSSSTWCGSQICEERNGSSGLVMRRMFTVSEESEGEAAFTSADHLGSVRNVTEVTGGLTARYQFDPFGRRELVAGADAFSSGFTGHQWESTAGVLLALYRGYDPDLGRWLSEDPAGLRAGPNLYEYVEGRTLNVTDPLGLLAVTYRPPILHVVSSSEIGGHCGMTRPNLDMGGDCRRSCKGGVKASLWITYMPEFYVAMDKRNSPSSIYSHELGSPCPQSIGD